MAAIDWDLAPTTANHGTFLLALPAAAAQLPGASLQLRGGTAAGSNSSRVLWQQHLRGCADDRILITLDGVNGIEDQSRAGDPAEYTASLGQGAFPIQPLISHDSSVIPE